MRAMKKFTVGVVLAVAMTLLGPVAAAHAAKIVVPPGGGPHVRMFNGGGGDLGGFFAFDPGFRGGVTVAIADVMNDSAPEIITGAGPGGGPNVHVFSMNGDLLADWNAYFDGFTGGVFVAAGDVNGDGKAEIITGP